MKKLSLIKKTEIKNVEKNDVCKMYFSISGQTIVV